MSLEEIFLNAATKAQQKEFCHKKLMKLVENAFDNSKLEELYKAFLKALYRCYYSNDYADKNPYIARGMEFLARIVMKITLKCVNPMEITDANGTVSQVYDITLDPFFNNVVSSSVKFACVEKSEVRFNTCYFITTLLQCIGNNVEMDQSVCNIILDSLVELLHDPKANIRIQAIKALVKLQEPSNADCVVLKSFWILSTDPNSEVRKSVISYMAPHPQSFIKIRNRLTDTDQGVKQAAFTKFADINPKLYLKIIDRNIILTCGLADKNKKIQHILTDKLLPKWLSFFKGNYLLFFKALRLDADENDINNFEKLCTELLDIFSRTHSLTDLMKYLPINKEDKLIPIQQLRLESVFYWAGVISYLRKTEDSEEYLENILPELTSFSNYIERVIKEKSSVAMEDWENLEFQNILYQLFKISSGFDMSDEAGRKTFYALILQILTTNKFQQKVIDQILQVASLLNTNKGSLSIDLCQVISEIREPLMDELPSEEKLRKQNFEMTQLRVKIHQLEIDEEEALKKKDFQHAHIVQNEIEKRQKELDNLKNMYVVSEKVRVSKDDPETLCRCLDILIGLLKITDAKDISPALQSCRDEFLMPLLSNNNSEVHWRFILCLGLFSLMDKELAFKHANFLCLPIATYRAIANYDKVALKTSVACVSDLIRMYGVKVIGVQENSQSEQNQDSNPTTSRRKLYSEDLSEPEILSKDDITIEFIIDIILDMLDDEDEGVRLTASTSICRLIVSNFPVSSELICRLILKWYNPETEKKDVKLHKQLGIIIECFVNNTKGAKKVVQKAILPIISSIVNASGTSPLLEIDMENVLRFLAALTNTIDDNDNENIHNEIAVDLIERMLNKPNDSCVPYLVKFLTYLELKFQDIDRCRSLITSTELLISDIVDKIPRKNLMKLRDKLVAGLKVATIEIDADRTENQTADGLTSITHPINGTEENIEDQSSLIRQSAVNGVSENAISEIDSDHIQKGNSSGSESDSEGGSVETFSSLGEFPKPITLVKKISCENIRKTLRTRTKLEKISEMSEEQGENSKSAKHEICSRRSSQSASASENVEKTDVYVRCDYNSEKNRVISTEPNKMLENTDKVNTGNVQVISQVILKKKTKENVEQDESFEKSSRSLRSNKSLAAESSDSNSVDSSKRKMRKRQGISDRERKTTKKDVIKRSPSKQSLRATSFPSKFKDYVTSRPETLVIHSEDSPRPKKTEKRTAQTPLSVSSKHKSKRLSKDPEVHETALSSSNISPFRKKNTKTSLPVGKRLSRRFSRSVTLSNRKNSSPRLSAVGLRTKLRKSLRSSNSALISPYSQGHLKVPSSTLTTTPDKISKTKKPKEPKFITKLEISSVTPSKKRNNRDAEELASSSKNESTFNKNSPKDSDKSHDKKSSKNLDVSSTGRSLRSKKGKNVKSKMGNDCRKQNNESDSSKRDIEDNRKIEQTVIPKKYPSGEKSRKKICNSNSETALDNKNKNHDRVKATTRNSRKIANKQNENETKKNNEDKKRSKQKVTNSVEAKSATTSGNSFKNSESKSNCNDAKEKDNIEGKNRSRSNQEVDNGVLQNLNNVMNKIKNTSSNRRSLRVSIKSRSKDNNKNTKISPSPQVCTPTPSVTRSRVSDRLNKSKSASRKQLDFSSFSDETILKTFLQGDEEFQVLEDISVENISNNSSNSSGDSKKENLSIDVSTSSSSSRRSSRRKRSWREVSPNTESCRRNKIMKTERKKNIQRVGR